MITDFKNMDIAQEIATKIQGMSKTLTPNNVLDFILLAMKIVEEKNISGDDKKKIVYLTLLKLINNLDDNSIKERRFVQTILDNVFNSFVDNTINVSKNPKDYFFKAKSLIEKMKPLLQIFSCKSANKR